MRHAFAATSATLVLAGSAFATVTPGTLFGDSYIVVDGARTFSVIDVYIKGSSSSDIISSTFGVTAYPSSYTLNNGKSFQQSNGTAASSWLPTNDDGSAWDSYVTCGTRVQGSDNTLAGGKAGFLGMQLDTNWAATSTGGQIVAAAGTGGPGWYPAVGASTSSNPYCRGGYNGGVNTTAGYWNTAKATRSITGNGVTTGMSLSNYWMVGRFTIDVTGDSATNNTLTMVFGVAGKQNGTTTFTGSTSTAGRFNKTLTFAANNPVPIPGAAMLLSVAGFATRRRRAA